MEITTLTGQNIDSEHICCAISDKKGENQVSSKKEWLKERFKDGLIFKKCNVQGKAFIEYIPAENAWSPIEANGYMYINCLWVSGGLKGQGLSTQLLNECIADSKENGRKGLVILSSKKKMPFLSDPKFLEHKGFLEADTAEPYYVLMYLPFAENIEIPCFKPCVKQRKVNESGFVLYYSNQCPYTSKYVSLIEKIALNKGISFKAVKFETKEQAQNAPAPFTTYSLFYNGKFITNEILSEKKFEKLTEEFGL